MISNDVLFLLFISKSKACPRTLTTPPSPSSQFSPPCSTTSHSTSLEMMSSVSVFTVDDIYLWFPHGAFLHCVLSLLPAPSGWSADVLLSHHVQHLLARNRQEPTCWEVNIRCKIYSGLELKLKFVFCNSFFSSPLSFTLTDRGQPLESVWLTSQQRCLWPS